MSKEQDQNWQWGSLDPTTRSVVAAFSGRLGDESRGGISSEAFIGSVTEAFDVTREDVTMTFRWTGAEGLRNVIARKLSGFEADPIQQLTQELGRLAGGGEAVILLAGQASEQLRGSDFYEAIPALQTLSELAIEQR